MDCGGCKPGAGLIAGNLPPISDQSDHLTAEEATYMFQHWSSLTGHERKGPGQRGDEDMS